ncbi:MAG: hypothetical protein IJ547_04065, partial [Clostridia bacterium]|nr:hypothetical protein [Clostridia bacterium]
TVALFIAQSAYTDAALQGAAKMGALFSVFAGIAVWVIKLLFTPFLSRKDRESALLEEAIEHLHERKHFDEKIEK